jgi:hypothetical protein
MILRIAAGILAVLFIWGRFAMDEAPRGILGIAALFGVYAIIGNKLKL